MRLAPIILLFGMLLLLGGCGSAPGSASTPSTSTAHDDTAQDTDHGGASPAGASGGAASSVGSAGPIGALTRSGGIQGKTETLVVGADGTLQLRNGDINGQVVKTAQAPQAQVDSLSAVFASSEWQQLAPKHGRQLPDGFAYTVSAGNKQVQTYDGAQNPPLLDTVLNQFNALWQVVQGGSS